MTPIVPARSAILAIVRFAQEQQEYGQHGVRVLFGEIVSGRDRPAADVVGPVAPDRQDIEQGGRVAVRRSEREQQQSQPVPTDPDTQPRLADVDHPRVEALEQLAHRSSRPAPDQWV